MKVIPFFISMKVFYLTLLNFINLAISKIILNFANVIQKGIVPQNKQIKTKEL